VFHPDTFRGAIFRPDTFRGVMFRGVSVSFQLCLFLSLLRDQESIVVVVEMFDITSQPDKVFSQGMMEDHLVIFVSDIGYSVVTSQLQKTFVVIQIYPQT